MLLQEKYQQEDVISRRQEEREKDRNRSKKDSGRHRKLMEMMNMLSAQRARRNDIYLAPPAELQNVHKFLSGFDKTENGGNLVV